MEGTQEARAGLTMWALEVFVPVCPSQLGVHSVCVADLWWPGGPLPSVTLLSPLPSSAGPGWKKYFH